jgi:hypothetical protein
LCSHTIIDRVNVGKRYTALNVTCVLSAICYQPALSHTTCGCTSGAPLLHAVTLCGTRSHTPSPCTLHRWPWAREGNACACVCLPASNGFLISMHSPGLPKDCTRVSLMPRPPHAHTQVVVILFSPSLASVCAGSDRSVTVGIEFRYFDVRPLPTHCVCVPCLNFGPS